MQRLKAEAELRRRAEEERVEAERQRRTELLAEKQKVLSNSNFIVDALVYS